MYMHGLLLTAKYAKLFAESAIVFYHRGNGVFHREQRGIFMHGSQSTQSFSRRVQLCFTTKGTEFSTESREVFLCMVRKAGKAFREERYCVFTTQETELSQRAKSGFVCLHDL